MDDSHLDLDSTGLLRGDASLIIPQQKHRIADHKKGSGWQCNYSIIERTNCLIIVLKRFALYFLVGKRKKFKKCLFFIYIYEDIMCAGIAWCSCVSGGFYWLSWLGYTQYFFLFFFFLLFASLSATSLPLCLKNPLCCVLLCVSFEVWEPYTVQQ